MPIYEYECKACDKVHEVIQKFSDKPLTKCPDCGKKVTKLISLSSFALKGSGYYTTDYKRPADEAKAKNSGKAKGSGEKGSGGGTASEPKAEAAPKASGGCGKSGCGHKH